VDISQDGTDMGNQKGLKPPPQFAKDFRLGATAATWVKVMKKMLIEGVCS